MVLGAYQGAVECRGTFEARLSCATILDDMEASRTVQVFGPISDPAAKVRLPALVASSKTFVCAIETGAYTGACRRRQERPPGIRQVCDFMVPHLGGCDRCLLSLFEEWKGRKRKRTRYVVNFLTQQTLTNVVRGSRQHLLDDDCSNWLVELSYVGCSI